MSTYFLEDITNNWQNFTYDGHEKILSHLTAIYEAASFPQTFPTERVSSVV